MKALLSKLADQLGRLPKVVIVICGLMYEVALGIVDYGTPPSMSFTLLYLLGIAFVGWGAGKNGAALVSLVSAGIVAANNLSSVRKAQQPVWTALWNASTGFLVFWGTGWLTAEVTQLHRHLIQLVEKRTSQWKAEADRHRETAARLAEREGQLLEISDREQARIGQELHDGLCQQLVSLAFDANSLEHELSTEARPESRIAKRLSHFLDLAITEARQVSRGLFPIRLEVEGLPSALEELARATCERFHIQCRFEADASTFAEAQSIATHLYRIAQEAVNNAVKHSQASTIGIYLGAQNDHLELKIEDDGIGILDRSLQNSKGMGLHIMDYRARSIGGQLHLDRGPRSGTVVSCRVPRARPRNPN
jgi:signal transduction histidine kinase